MKSIRWTEMGLVSRPAMRVISTLLFALGTGAAVGAATLTFERISSNAPTDIAEQLSINLVEFADEALLIVTNTDPAGSFIAQIYIDDDAGLLESIGFSEQFSTAGVSLVEGAGPANLPSGSERAVNFAADFALGAANPSPKNGISFQDGDGIAERGAINVTFVSFQNFAMLETALTDGSVRVGMHVQGIGAHSDSFVNLPLAEIQVPEPAIGVLALVGICGLLSLRRRLR